MEKSHSENPKSSESSFVFPPHRRSHLRSQTYRTLVRIVSHCYDGSSSPDTATAIVPQEPNPDNSSNDFEQANEKEMSEPGRSDSDRMGPGNPVIDESFEAVGSQDDALNDMQMENGKMDRRMRTEEDEYLYNQKEIIISENTEVKDSQNGKFSGEKMLMYELEQILAGDGVLIQNNSVDVSTATLENDQGTVAVLNNQEQVDPQKIVMEEQPGVAGQQQVDEENGCKIGMDALNLSVDKNLLLDELELEQILKGNEEPIQNNSFGLLTASLESNELMVAVINNEVQVDAQQIVMEEQYDNAGQQQIDDKFDGKNCVEALNLSVDKSMLLDELEQILKENEELIQNFSVDLSAASLQNNQGMVAVINNEEQVDPQQIVMEEQFGDAGQQRIDEENGCKNGMEALNLSIDTNMTTKTSKPSENIEEQGSSLKKNEFEGEHKVQQKVIVLDKSMHISGMMSSNVHTTEDKETEEGEISGDSGSDDKSINVFCEDAVLSKGKAGEEKIFQGVIDKEIFSCDGQKRSHKKDSNSSSSVMGVVKGVDNGRETELEESVIKNLICKPETVVCGSSSEARKSHVYDCHLEAGKIKENGNRTKEGVDRPAACPNNLVFYGDILEENITGDQAITSTAKDFGECNKKKRGRPSKERKEKKKQKERKKRAEKNRQLGVKRLKLQPVLKEKPVSYCRHYLKGRCQEGDKCKFSHDTVPLTKSKPCCHFARHSCMKGDDCPFDHQLSKYPCSNYVSKGFCSRGDDCMFSHKILAEEASQTAPDACNSPSLTEKSNSFRQSNSRHPSHQNVNSLSHSFGICSSSKTEQKETLSKELAPKGISCLSVGKTTIVKSGKLNQAGSSPKRDDGVELGSKTDQSTSSTTQKSNLPPKGINFLAFGKAPFGISSNKKVACSTSNLDRQVSPYANRDDSINVDCQSSPKKVQNPNELGKNTQPADLPLGINFMSFGKSQANYSSSDKQATLPSSSNNSINRSVEETRNDFPWRLPASLLTSGQFSDCLALGHYKNTPNSANKALLSTLAFAAKYESEVKISKSIGAPENTEAKDTKINSTAGGLQNDLAKASRILEFLSSGGSNAKQ